MCISSNYFKQPQWPVMRMHGFTLVEIIITIVILAIAITAIGALVANTVRASADPILHTQAIYLAESYLEEITLKSYLDPDGINEGCSVGRDLWDDIGDYGNCMGSALAPTDPQGNAIGLLSRYRIQVQVAAPTVVAGASTRRIQVRVTHLDGRIDISLVGFRAQY